MNARVPLSIGLCLACSCALATSPSETQGTFQLAFDLVGVHRYLATNEILTSLPSPTALGVERLLAFEDHEHFAYVYGASREAEGFHTATPDASPPQVLRRLYFIRPGLLVIDDQLDARRASAMVWTLYAPGPNGLAAPELTGAGNGLHYRCQSLLPQAAAWNVAGNDERPTRASHTTRPHAAESAAAWLRSIHVVSFTKDRLPALPVCSVERHGDAVRLDLVEKYDPPVVGRIIRLLLPDGTVSGRVEIIGSDGKAVVSDRLLPAGILPPDLGAAQRRLQWDLPYQAKTHSVWDTGHASSELKRMVDSGEITPCRAVELGCGAGNDAIYLARQGFDVTAIDISPTALNLAEKKAREAGVQVEWLLADILHPPRLLKPFDFVYDRGCYHEVRQHHAKEYVAALESLTDADSKILILAASANKDTYWRFEGPPRVREQAIRNDFVTGFRLLQLREFRFDPAPPERGGALAWSILLTRQLPSSTINPRDMP